MEELEDLRQAGTKHYEQLRGKQKPKHRPRSVKKRGTARVGGETVKGL